MAKTRKYTGQQKNQEKPNSPLQPSAPPFARKHKPEKQKEGKLDTTVLLELPYPRETQTLALPYTTVFTLFQRVGEKNVEALIIHRLEIRPKLYEGTREKSQTTIEHIRN